MFIVALFTIAKIWKQTKCPLIDAWIKKMWYTYIMEYYTTTKVWYLVIQITWMDLEGIMPNEKSQTEKYKYHIISLIGGI